MLALLLLASVPAAMWMTQSALLLRVGERPRWRISAPDVPLHVKRANRIATYVLLIAVVAVYPWLRGKPISAWINRMFPPEGGAGAFAFGLAAAMLYLLLLYLAWTLTDNVRFRIRHRPSRLLRRLATVPLTAILAAGVEEVIFRGMLLQELLEQLPVGAAVVVGVLVFAGAHYVRSVKRTWTIGGHLALGVLFCMAYVWTGSLWLPMGLHAGGILVLMGVRPMIQYVGPPWLVGASIFPYAGVLGIAALLLLTLNLWLRFGTSA